jgi:hypothetical protein
MMSEMACRDCLYWYKGQGVTVSELQRGWGRCAMLSESYGSGIPSPEDVPERINIGSYEGTDVSTAPDFFCAEFRKR